MGIRQGCLSLTNDIKKGKRGRASPDKTFLSTPPPPPLLSRGANTVIALQDELNAACGVNLNIFYDKFSIKPPGRGHIYFKPI